MQASRPFGYAKILNVMEVIPEPLGYRVPTPLFRRLFSFSINGQMRLYMGLILLLYYIVMDRNRSSVSRQEIISQKQNQDELQKS